MQDTTKDVIVDENEQIAVRKEKLKNWRNSGGAYPNQFKRAHYAGDLFELHAEKEHDMLETEKNQVQVAGRIMTRRLMGKASFVHIQDMTGRIQVYLRKSDLDEGVYDQFLQWDIGDIIGISGQVFKTKTGELSIKAITIELLTKSLRPLPDKWHGLADQETRYRQRYLDLIVNKESRNVFEVRTKIVQGIRDFLIAERFLEVETPMMQVIPGGAAARPFITHHNALDIDLYLRIAPELYLKRLVVGGFERVFEINRNFRNEGLSTRHNPEFTMLEFYQAYATYEDLISLTEAMLKQVAQDVLGKMQVTYQEINIDFSQPFAVHTIKEAIAKYATDINAEKLDDKTYVLSKLNALDVNVEVNWGIGRLQLELFEQIVEPKLIQPTFITQYPTEVSPLSRKNDNNPEVTDRFELFIGGKEIANGFSELNDPEDQAERFKQQVENKQAGDEEAMHYDADYVRALEYGLPPTAGEGIGIDRLVMLFTDSPAIRDVLLFPHMRPKAE